MPMLAASTTALCSDEISAVRARKRSSPRKSAEPIRGTGYGAFDTARGRGNQITISAAKSDSTGGQQRTAAAESGGRIAELASGSHLRGAVGVDGDSRTRRTR